MFNDGSGTLRPDPRVSHTFNLAVDDYGNVLHSVAVSCGCRFDDPEPLLTAADRKKQKQLFATLTEASFTNAVIASDAYRTPLPAGQSTYELLRLLRAAQQPGITNLFRFEELVLAVAKAGDGAHDLPYEDINATGARAAAPYRRLIERMRTRYPGNNLAQLLLPLGSLQALAVPGETYKLAFTPGLISSVYQWPRSGQLPENLLPNPGAVLPASSTDWADRGGYVTKTGGLPSVRSKFSPGAIS